MVYLEVASLQLVDQVLLGLALGQALSPMLLELLLLLVGQSLEEIIKI